MAFITVPVCGNGTSVIDLNVYYQFTECGETPDVIEIEEIEFKGNSFLFLLSEEVMLEIKTAIIQRSYNE